MKLFEMCDGEGSGGLKSSDMHINPLQTGRQGDPAKSQT